MQEIEAWDGQAQGDKEDRDKIREVERARVAAAKRQSEADELTMEARNLAALGYSVPQIAEELDRLGVGPPLSSLNAGFRPICTPVLVPFQLGASHLRE